MNKYKVKVIHVFNEILDVEAETEDQAREVAVTKLTSDTHKANPTYETTIPAENWPVITDEQFSKIVEEKVKEESNIITPSIITP